MNYHSLSKEEQEDKIAKAIRFIRVFNTKSDGLTYREAVLRFCDLVEAYVNPAPELTDKDVEQAFGLKD